MSVLASDRPVSKFEAVCHAHVMRDMFNQLVLRNFGIRDVGPITRRKYILGKDNIENRDKYECLLDEYRGAIVRFAASVVQDISAANAIYPKKLERIQPTARLPNPCLSCLSATHCRNTECRRYF